MENGTDCANDDICAVLDQLIDGGDAPGALADFMHDHAHHAARLARLRAELAAPPLRRAA